MEISKLSSANQIYLNKSEDNKSKTIQESPKEIKDGKKKVIAALAGLGVLGTAAVMVLKGKANKANDIAQDASEVLSKKISDINFNKGIAKQGDELFTGVIEDTLKNGKKITLEYENGIIQKATKDGVEKTFDYDAVKKLVDEATDEQEKLNNLLKNSKHLSSDDFKKQADEIKYKTSKQKDEISSTYRDLTNKEEAIKRSKKEIALKQQQELKQEKYNKIFDEKLSNKSAKESAEVFIAEENKRLAQKEQEALELQKAGKYKELFMFMNKPWIQSAQEEVQANLSQMTEEYAQRLNKNKSMIERANKIAWQNPLAQFMVEERINLPSSKAMLDALGKLNKEKQAAISDVTLNKLLFATDAKDSTEFAKFFFKNLPKKLDIFTAEELIKIQASKFGTDNLCKYIIKGTEESLLILKSLVE